MAAVLDDNTARSGEPAHGPSFEPYARLLRVLMPSLAGVVVHDAAGALLWRSDEWDLADRPEIVRGTLAAATLERETFAGSVLVLGDDHVVYSFAIGGGPTVLGVASLVTRLGARAEPRAVATVRALVLPALECLARELALRVRLGGQQREVAARERELSTRERSLTATLEMYLKDSFAGGGADEYTGMLKAGLEHVGCALAALWVPDKNIFVTQTRSGQPLSAESLERARQHLMAWMRLQQRTLVINHIARVASDVSAPYKILACPIRHRSERVMGVFALFNPPSADDFDAHQVRLAELLAGKATAAIEAQYDPATGLLTRRAFEKMAEPLLAADAGRGCVLYLDIDRLHVVNETFGMHVGDEVIADVAEQFARCLPAEALSARISGDRLAALLAQTGRGEAAAVAEAVRKAATDIRPRAGRGVFEVSVCIGVASVGAGENPLPHALATAEIACKAAKDRGRNRVEVFQDADQSIIRRHTDVLVVGKLREALDNDDFRLDAQPILPLRGNYGAPRFELLIRMLGDRGEVIPPGKFLSAAERYQLMPAVDRWVVRRACELLSAHAGAVGRDSARFAVNLSGQSLQEPGFLDYVVERIRDSGLAPGVLCFELTETATVGNLANAQRFMATLRALGCQFALDDFGTGVSSLAYLRDLSVDYLKIDGSFVRGALDSSRSQSMIKAIAQLAKIMRMQTVAEYVETDALRECMADLGVDYGQGFAMGKAQPLTELLEELAIYEATVTTWALPGQATASD